MLSWCVEWSQPSGSLIFIYPDKIKLSQIDQMTAKTRIAYTTLVQEIKTRGSFFFYCSRSS